MIIIFLSITFTTKKGMALFNHKIKLTELIREIPDAELGRLSKEAKQSDGLILDGPIKQSRS